MTRLFLLLARHRLAVFLAAAVIAVAALAQSRKIRLEDDFMAMAPRNEPAVADFLAYDAAFHQLERMYFDISLPVADETTLIALGDEMEMRLAAMPGFKRIVYRLDAYAQQGLADAMMRLAPNIMTEKDIAEIGPKLEEAAIRERLSRARQDLSGPQGMVLKAVIPYDPIGFASLVFSKLESLRAGIGDVEPVEGRIFSADRRHLMLIAEPDFPSSDAARTRALLDAAMKAAREVEAARPDAGARIALTGGHRAAMENAEISERDVRLTLSISAAAMFALALAAYRRRWLALLTLLPTAFGALVAGALLSLAHEAIYAISVGFGVVLIGVAIDFSIHILFHLENDAAPDGPSRARQLAELAAPIATGGATTIGAFLLMALSPVSAHKQVGLFAAIGLASTAIFALAVLPLLVPLSPPGESKPLPLAALFHRIMEWRSRHLGATLSVALAFTIFCALGAARLRFDGDVRKLSGITAAARADEESVSRAWGGALSLSSAMAQGGDEGEAMERNERLAKALAELEGAGRVGGVSSLAGLLPSRATQELNAARWKSFWSPDRREAVAAAVDRAASGLGYRSGAFDPFFKLISEDSAPYTLGDLLKGPLAPVIEPRIARNGHALNALFKPKDPGAVEALRAKLGPGFAVVDGEALISRVGQMARRGLLWFALWAAVAAALALVLMLGSVELAMAVLAPLALGALWTFGVMGWLGLPVNIANFIFIIFIIGVGDDCCIFLATSRLARLRGEGERMDASGGSILICTLATLIACGVLVVADHPALFSIGAACSLGMALSFAAAIVFVPLSTSALLARAEISGCPRWWHLVGGVGGAAYLLGAEAFLLGVALPLARLRYRKEPERALALIRRLGREGPLSLFKYFPYGRTQLIGLDPSLFERPCIVVSNHQSAIDIPLIALLPGDVRLTLKRRVWNAPWFGIGARKLGHVMVEPERPEATLERCRALLAEGASIHFFAEGTRSADGFLQRFHKGAFQLAVELNCDLLPIVICDSRRCLPSSGYWVEPFTMSVRALPRVTPQSFDYSLGPRPLMKHAKGLIAAAHQEELDRLNTPAAVRRKVGRRYRYLGARVEGSVAWSLSRDPIYPALDGLLPREGRIIEIGCGWGLRGHWLTEFTNGRKYIGLDWREDRLAAARASLQSKRHATFEPLEGFAWRPEMADAIILGEAEAREPLLAQAGAALKPGGLLLIPDPAPDDRQMAESKFGFRLVESPDKSRALKFIKPLAPQGQA